MLWGPHPEVPFAHRWISLGVVCVLHSLWQAGEGSVLDTFGSGLDALDTVLEVLHQ